MNTGYRHWAVARARRIVARCLASAAAVVAVTASASAQAVSASPATPVGGQPVTVEQVTGALHFIWGDPQHAGELPQYQVSVVEASGRTRAFAVDARDGTLVSELQRAAGQRVTLEFTDASAGAAGFALPSLPQVRAVRTLGSGGMSPAPRASARLPQSVQRRPYALVMCKFADADIEPFSREQLLRMYLGGRGSAEDFLREVSRGRITMEGTTATPWVRLPRPRSAYLPGGTVDLPRLATDCMSAADSIVDYSRVSGVGMHFNTALGCCSWGGVSSVALDGPARDMPTMWNMEWARSGVIWHELGHVFGLPHSSGPYFFTYDSNWDVMSNGGGGVYFDDLLRFGGAHFIAWHKDRLGLIPDSSRVEVTGPLWRGLISPHADGDGPGAQLVVVPVPNSATGALLTVEARRRTGYDLRIAGEGIMITTVDPARAEPAQVFDLDGNGEVNDRGAIFRASQRFVDPRRGISVAVDSQTAAGWWVTIQRSVTTAAAPRFEQQAASHGLASVSEVRRDSVRVLASGAWRIRAQSVPWWLRAERSAGSGNGWFVYRVLGGTLPAGRAVATITFEVDNTQTVSTFRIEAGLVTAPENLAFLSRTSRRVELPPGASNSARDSIAIRLTGTWASATWSVTPSTRYLVDGASSQQPRIEGSGPAVLRLSVASRGLTAGVPVVDSLSVTVRGPSTVVLTMIDTIVVDASGVPTAWSLSARSRSTTVPVGLRLVDSVQVQSTVGGSWGAFSQRGITRFLRREGVAGDWLVYTRESTAPGLRVDSLWVSPTSLHGGVSSVLFVDSVRAVDVPLRLTTSRPPTSATVTLGQMARFDSVIVHVLGQTGTGLQWSAGTTSPSLRLHVVDPSIPMASGVSGQSLRWSRFVTSLAPGRYIDTITITLDGAANSPLRLVDTTVVAPPPPMVGDVDNDGVVSAADGLVVLRWLVQLPLPPRSDVPRTGDANCDGRVTVADALLLLQFEAGLPLATSCVGRSLTP